MNARNYKTITELLKTINASLVTYAFAVTLLFTFGISRYAPLSLLLLIIPIISRYLEHHGKHLITFLLCHIMLGLFLFLIPQNLIVRILYGLYTLIIMIYHFIRRVKRKPHVQGSMFYACLFLLIIMQIYANWREYIQLTNIIMIISFLYILLYFINVYLLNYIEFFTNEILDVNVNIHQIKRSNHTLMFIFMAIISIVMIGSFSIPSINVLSILKSIGIYLLQLFFSLFHFTKPTEEIEKVGVNNVPRIEDLIPSETTEPNPLWSFIEDKLLDLCFIAMILIIASFIIYGAYQLYKQFHTVKINKTDQKEFVSPFFKESKEKNSKKMQKTKIPFFLNPSEKIRRYFYLEMKKKYKDKVPNNLTADELINLPVQSISLLLSEEPNQLDPQILRLYHKARYSSGTCSKEEVNAMKKIIKENK